MEEDDLKAILTRNPDNADVAKLVAEYRNLAYAYDTLQEGVAALLAVRVIRFEDAPAPVRRFVEELASKADEEAAKEKARRAQSEAISKESSTTF